MSGIIHFGSGKELEITEVEFSRMGPKLNAKGIRTQVTATGHLIPLNSTTMEFIEHVPEPVYVDEPMTEAEYDALPEDQNVQVEKKPVKTQEELLAKITSKSNCKHEPEKMEMFIQHTSKGYRYFPVCSFCGKRERYVSEKKITEGGYAGTPNARWTADDIANAQPWIEN